MSVRLKSLADVIAGQSPESSAVDELGDGLPFIQGNAEFGLRHPSPVWQSDEAPKRARAGDLLLSVRAPVGALNIADGDIGVGRGVAAVRSRRPTIQRWLYWALEAARAELVSMATGSTFGAVSASDIQQLRLSVPTDPERVADYLDHETAEIDAFIADLETAHALTAQRLRVLSAQIASASGEQRSEKITWHYQVRNGLTPKSDNPRFWDNGSIPWVNSSVVNLPIVAEPSRLVNSAALNELGLPIIKRGSLLVGLTGEGRTRGMVTQLGIDTTISQHVAALTRRRGSVLSEGFLLLSLTSAYDILRSQSSGNGGTKGGITCEMIQQFKLVVPSSAVQDARVGEWKLARSQADGIRADIDAAIALAKERRAALITAAVTGQIDVTAKQRPTVDAIHDAIEEAR